MIGPALTGRRLLFVTGKGGVGKTTVAAGLALMLAEQGKTVLACEIDAKGDLSAAYEIPPVGFDPVKVTSSLSVMAMDTEASLREYLRLNLKIPIMGRIGPLAAAFDFVATAAPGVREILTVGKICWEVRERHYDVVVVDAPASGHIISQLAAPDAIAELVRIGPIRNQSQWMAEILNNPQATGVVVATTAEEMPIAETIELTQRLEQETSVEVAGIVVNRVLPERFGPREAAAFAELKSDTHRAWIDEHLPEGAPAVLEATRLATQLRRHRSRHLHALRREMDPSVPLYYLPELFTRAEGLRMTRQVATHLAEELG